MYTILCCNGYYLVGKTYDKNKAERIAREHIDGDYACYIYQGGKIVGDCIDGITGAYSEGPPPYDAATATGMYDRY